MDRSNESPVIRDAKKDDAEYVADAHKRIYSAEYSWSEGFWSYAGSIARRFFDGVCDPREGFWIAEIAGKPMGSVMLVKTDDSDTGMLRLFIVEKEARHMGVGSALAGTLLKKARDAGYKKLILWTAEPLKDAIRLYAKLGFKKIETSTNTSWRIDGGEVIEEKWEMTL